MLDHNIKAVLASNRQQIHQDRARNEWNSFFTTVQQQLVDANANDKNSLTFGFTYQSNAQKAVKLFQDCQLTYTEPVVSGGKYKIDVSWA